MKIDICPSALGQSPGCAGAERAPSVPGLCAAKQQRLRAAHTLLKAAQQLPLDTKTHQARIIPEQ